MKILKLDNSIVGAAPSTPLLIVVILFKRAVEGAGPYILVAFVFGDNLLSVLFSS